MAAPSHKEIFQILVERGLLAADSPPQALPTGNVDRRPGDARTSWRATAADGAPLKLTLGGNLTDLSHRHQAFALDCPDLVPPLAFFVPTPHGDAMAEPFFEGLSVREALTRNAIPADVVRAALAGAIAQLSGTSQRSTPAARQSEWETWCTGLLSQPVWSDAERRTLRDQVLVRLFEHLGAAAPATRWSNGDFTPDNLLINATGAARLIDLEFASRTHFFTEDAVRFPAFSAEIRALFASGQPVLPTPGLAWHLFFWLRQFALEAAQNTASYVERVRARRLGEVRLLAEQVLGCRLPDWSQPTPRLHHRLEVMRWRRDQPVVLHVAGWAQEIASPFQAVAAFSDLRLLATALLHPRPDVAQHLGLATPEAGFALDVPLADAGPRLTLAGITAEGIFRPFWSTETAHIPGRPLQFEHYEAWAAQHDADPAAPPAPVASPLLFSILLPVYNPPATMLRECLRSVCAQHHANWELVVVDDASRGAHVAPILEQFAAQDRRITVHRHAANGGIARATNTALAAARGAFVVLLDHDDLLRPHALAELAARLASEPDLDVLYSDEDKITAEGRRVLPLLKPDFSPEFLLGVMYVGHLLCVRTAVAREVGGFLPEYDGVQDYEFLLRVTSRTRRVGHVSRQLYHWRQSPTSSALLGNVKGDMDARQLAAVRAQLARAGDSREAIARGGHRVRLIAGPNVPSHEVFTASPARPGALSALQEACAQTSAEIVILLSAPVLESSDGWARELAAAAARPDAGCVAPILLGRDGRVLAAGWTAGPAGTAPLLRGFQADDDGYHGSLECNREVLLVSPECVALRREVARRVLAQMPPDATWWDFCARLRVDGNYHRTCAAARLRLDLEQLATLPGVMAGPDPFLNPHFDRQAADYSLAPGPGQPAAPVVRFHFDRPSTWTTLPRCVVVRGWAYAGAPVKGVRLRVGNLVFPGVVGLPRPDVSAAMPAINDDFTGFEIRASFPPGPVQVIIEIEPPDGGWQVIFNCSSLVPRRAFPLWLTGGDWTELSFRFPAHMAHAPRPLRPEKFPATSGASARPRFAIVTPSYNQARFLSETMRSVLEQRGVTCDYVVQDGGSTDGSVELIRQHAGRLQAWVTERDAGQADAIAKGFARTRGGPADLMAWINSDDFYQPGALAFVADYFARHPEVDVLYGNRIVVDEDSQEIARWFLPGHDPEVLRLNDYVPQETLFWRRRVWDKVGGINTSFKFALDWDLLLRFQASGARIVHVPYFLGCFRVHTSQKTSAQLHDIGQREIARLREHTHGRPVPQQDLERNPHLLRYLRRSAWMEFLWKFGLRAN